MNKVFFEIKYGTIATYVFLGINTLIFIFAQIFSILPIYESKAYLLGGANIYSIFQGEIWRLITANYLHVSVMHFAFNMVGLVYYGKFVERFYSAKKLVIIYTITGIVGAFASAFFYPNAISYGASTALLGFIGVMLGNSFKKDRYSPGLPIDTNQIWPGLVAWLIMGFMIPGISGWGHLGGLVAGIFLGMVLETENSFKNSELQNNLVSVLFWGSIGITALSYVLLVVNLFN